MDKKGRPLSNSDIASADAVLVTTPPLLGPGAAMDQKDSYFPYATMNPTPEMSPFDPAAPIARTAMTTYTAGLSRRTGTQVPKEKENSRLNFFHRSLDGGRFERSCAAHPGHRICRSLAL